MSGGAFFVNATEKGMIKCEMSGINSNFSIS
jgi:hypothetical protein